MFQSCKSMAIVKLYGKEKFANVIKDSEMGKLSWIIKVGLT